MPQMRKISTDVSDVQRYVSDDKMTILYLLTMAIRCNKLRAFYIKLKFNVLFKKKKRNCAF